MVYCLFRRGSAGGMVMSVVVAEQVSHSAANINVPRGTIDLKKVFQN
ncbi:MAG: hypothetical protein LBI95_01470 [Holosporales bacterium]|jgi:hypothetical protein|nr:hypothetical protein [Holosporales bacterium]